MLACSLGPEDLVLIDLLTAIRPQVRAFFLDTDFHFPETLQLQQQVLARYPHLQLEIFKPLLTPEEQAAQYGPELYRTNPDLCCNIRKVEPLNRALANCTTWITGMRREQSPPAPILARCSGMPSATASSSTPLPTGQTAKSGNTSSPTGSLTIPCTIATIPASAASTARRR